MPHTGEQPAAHQIVLDHSIQGCALREAFFTDHVNDVVNVARTMAVALTRGGRILLAGNGGSAADAQHLAAEFVNRFVLERPPLPALALTTDTSALTAIANDYIFAEVFSKQIQALAQPEDIFIAISTSGNSTNLVCALETARKKNITTVGLVNKSGGEMAALCDFLLGVPGTTTALIQEVHIAVGHMLCQLVDYYLFEAVTELKPWLEKS